MSRYDLRHLRDHELLRCLEARLAAERSATAETLATLAEVDARRLYVPEGYPSLFQFCVGRLHLSDDAAAKRIQAARAARAFPVLFDALADGRLHLTAVRLLAPHLSPANVDDLVAAATHRSRREIEELLAERFPQLDRPTLLLGPADEHAPGHVGTPADGGSGREHAPGHAGTPADPGSGREHAPGHVAPAPRSSPLEATRESRGPGGRRGRLAPLAPDRVALECTISRATYEQIRYAQALLGRDDASRDLATLLADAVAAYVAALEKRRFAATSRGRAPRRASANPRYVPAHVRRAVWSRDGGRCTFVSEAGHRCEATSRLEFDHVTPVARGGEATAANLRLRCRAHNQHEADRTYGAGFMREKREAAREAAAARRVERERARQAARAAAARVAGAATPASAPPDADVIPWLRQLGFRMDEARQGAANCAHLAHAPLEQRVKFAIASLAPAHVRPRPASA